MSKQRLLAGSHVKADNPSATPPTSIGHPPSRWVSAHSRRTVAKALAWGGAAALIGPQLGTAQEASPSASPAPSSGPIIRSAVPGVPDLYLERPPQFVSVPEVPGSGGTVTSFHISFQFAVPTPREDNPYWQDLERRLGVTLEPIIAPAGDYQERLAATVAGGDLPDLTLIVLSQAPDHAQVIQQGAWADLTPYLTGEALRQYPNLAAFPEYLWENVAIDGKIYGVPRPGQIVPGTLMFRKDWQDNLGIPDPTNAEEFFQLMVAITEQDPDGNGRDDTWAISSDDLDYGLRFFEGMFRVPNEWRLNDDGILTSKYETDEYREAVAFARRLFEAGMYHPDAGTMNSQQAEQLFAGGQFGAYDDDATAVAGLQRDARQITPNAEVIGLVPVGYDGGASVTHKGSGFIGFVAIPATSSSERVEELLRILNYFCAPYGSEEEKFLNHGIEGIHHEVLPDGTLQNTEQRTLDRGDLANLTEAPMVFTTRTDDPEAGRRSQQLFEQLVSIGIDDPTLNEFSLIAEERAGELSQLAIDRIGAIIAGREPLEAIDQFVADWRSRGGDEIRQEYEQDLQGQ